MNYFLPEAKITRDQGKVFDVDGRLVVPMFHPAYKASRKQRNGSIHGDDEKTARCGSYASGNYASERICDEETTSPAIAAFLKLRSKRKGVFLYAFQVFSVNRLRYLLD